METDVLGLIAEAKRHCEKRDRFLDEADRLINESNEMLKKAKISGDEASAVVDKLRNINKKRS